LIHTGPLDYIFLWGDFNPILIILFHGIFIYLLKKCTIACIDMLVVGLIRMMLNRKSAKDSRERKQVQMTIVEEEVKTFRSLTINILLFMIL
jgi:hypothetical protein